MPHRLSALLRQDGYWTTRVSCTASRHHRTVAIGPDSKESFKRFKGEEWEMFNSTDEVWPP